MQRSSSGLHCNALWDTWLCNGHTGPGQGAGPKYTNVGHASAAEDETLEFVSVIHLLPGRLQLQISDIFKIQPNHEELELR